MADSNDDAKIKEALDKEVETPKGEDETLDKGQDPSPSADDTEEQNEEQNSEESSSDSSEESKSTFTKPTGYEWVKGDTLEEFAQNLQVAYENSSKEALKLRQATQATPTPPVNPENQTPANPPANQDLSTLPEIQMLRAEQQSKMIGAFDEFVKEYPQAREPQSFDQLEKAMNGVSQAFTAANGRLPTYPELFKATADLLSWQPTDKNAGKKDAAIKEAGASTGTTQQSAVPSSVPSISPNVRKSIEVARRIPGNAKKSDQELMKELASAVKDYAYA